VPESALAIRRRVSDPGDKELMPRAASEANGLVGRAFVAELSRGRQRIVHGKASLVGKDRAQHPGRRRRFDRAVEMRGEVGGREMHAAVGGVD
jgi:hypothetical protein